MRRLFALALVSSLAACGGGSSNSDVDASGGSGSGTPDAPASGATPAIAVVSGDATLQPGEEITYCYYFHTSNTSEVLINKWVSDMQPGSHHAILFLNPGATSQPADGTLDPSGNCGGLSSQGGASVWTYATQTVHQEVDLPGDDGNGKPLAQKIAPNTPAVLQLHYLNATDNPLKAHIDLKAFALPAGTAYTQTDAYVTYNQSISIPPGAVGKVVTGTCPLPAGVKFWNMSTHSHKQSVATAVDDGATPIFQATDWEHPGAMSWSNPTFYTFTNNSLTWSCTYDNNLPCAAGETTCNKDKTVVSGPSASKNEMCMATGYFFPSTGPKFEVQYGDQCIAL